MAHSSAVTRARPDPAVLRRAARKEIIGLLLVLATVVLLVSPWLTGGSPDQAKDIHRNEVFLGIGVLLVVIDRFGREPAVWHDVLVLLSGVWLAVSPWAIALQDTVVFDGAPIVDVTVGSLYVLLSAVSLLMLWRIRRHQDGDGASAR
ncbi:SPW repeat domain-containing protein [Streptomyces minutiscleroticus]|nr:hypothetical protein [Streptomyces minutiscleroticus]